MVVKPFRAGLHRTLALLLCLGAALLPASAEAKPLQKPKATTALRNPDKIGAGAYPINGMSVMATDVRRLGARWYYDWGPQGSGAAFQSWTLPLPKSTSPSRTAHFTVASAPDVGAPACVEYQAGQRSLGATALPLAAAAANQDLSVSIPADATALRLSLPSAAGASASLVQAAVQAGGNGDKLPLRPMPAAKQAAPAPPRFVPMIWGATDATALLAGREPAASDTLLGFNEPDHAQQSNLTVETALSLWPALMATGRRLSSPATTTSGTLGPQSWLGRFMAGAEAKHYRVDFIAVHYYPQDPSIPAFRSFLEKVHAAYRRPIWITEWALADWKDQSRFSIEEQHDFFRQAVRMLDTLPYVERHAWFGTYRGLDSWDLGNHLIERNGTLSPLGEAFRQVAASHAWHPDCDSRRAARSAGN